jgi:hypothetical protein
MTAGSLSYTRGEDPLRADKLNASFSERLLVAGDTMTGPLILSRPPVQPFEAATKAYIDNLLTVKLLLTVGDTPPFGVVPNTLWWHSAECQLYIYYDDGTSKQWVPASTLSALNSYAPLASPVFTGDARAVTAAPGDNDTSIATTAFVTAAITARGGVAEAPSDGSSYGRLNAAWAKVLPFTALASTNPGMDGVMSPGTSTTVSRADHIHPIDASRYAASNPSGYQTAAQVVAVVPSASSTTPVMDGTAAVGVGTAFARSDHVHPSDTSRAPLASPAFSGSPTAPTTIADTSSTQVATTAFVLGQAGALAPTMDGTATVGTSLRYTRQDHVHPTDTSRAPIASPTFTGTLRAPTIAATGALTLNAISVATTDQLPVLATTSLVGLVKPDGTTITVDGTGKIVAVGGGGGLTDAVSDGSSYGRLNATWAKVAPLASPVLTGSPAAPTAAVDTNTTQLATTAFVISQAGTAAPIMDSSGSTTAGTSTRFARQDHIHPSDSSRYPTTNPVGYQTALQVSAAITPTLRYANSAINSGFVVNQRNYASGTALAANAFGHDRWKGGAGGCTYTFTQSGNPSTTLTITAGTLQQVVEGITLVGGTYVLSWTGTAQGRIGAASYGASPVTATVTAGTNTAIEFNAGTVAQVKFEIGATATTWQARGQRDELSDCQRFYCTLPGTLFPCGSVAGPAYSNTILWPVAMRATPTVTTTGFSYSGANSGSLGAANASGCYLSAISSGGSGTFATCTVNATADL